MFVRLIIYTIAVFATLVSTEQVSNSTCLEPYEIKLDCKEKEKLQYYQFSVDDNACVRGPLTCPQAQKSNVFENLTECEIRCPAVQCPHPLNISNGTVNETWLSSGQQLLVYSCNDGYTLDGTKERVCQYNGSWNDTEPSCIPEAEETCTLPNPPANGAFEKTTLPNYIVIKYKCNSGFVLVGSSERSCSPQSLTWTGQEPKCVDISDVTCPEPTKIEKANTIKINCHKGPQKVGCFLMHTCEKNYDFVMGSMWRRCNENGEWSGTSPFCGRIFVTHDDKEVTEIKAKQGDKDLQVNCKMEPSFPSHSLVQWNPIGDKTIWVENGTAYALQFQVMNFSDAGEYTCSISKNIKSRIAIEVLSSTNSKSGSIAPILNINPDQLAVISPYTIMLTCIFSGDPKPAVTWLKDGQNVTTGGNIEIDDLVPNDSFFTYSVLTIIPPTQGDFGTYTCKANNIAGELAYDIVASAPNVMKRKRRSITEKPIKKHSKLICTENNRTVVFVGEYIKQLHNSNNYHVKIIKILPSRLATNNKSLPMSGDIIKTHDPDDWTSTAKKTSNLRYKDSLPRNKNWIFITKSKGQEPKEYELEMLYPYMGNLEKTLIKLCS